MVNKLADGRSGESRESPGLQTCVVHCNGDSHVWLAATILGSSDESTSLLLQRAVGQLCSRPFV